MGNPDLDLAFLKGAAPETGFDLGQAVAQANAAYFQPDLLSILKRCRVHVGIRAIEGKGDSRELVNWLDAEIEKREK